jgi:hypothetical protein
LLGKAATALRKGTKIGDLRTAKALGQLMLIETGHYCGL